MLSVDIKYSKRLTGIMFMLLILFSSMNLFSCKPEPVIPDNPTDTTATNHTKLSVVWTENFQTGRAEYFNDPIFWGDYVIVANIHGYKVGIRVLHKVTGEDHPAWNHEPGGIVESGHEMGCIHVGGENNSTLYTGDTYRTYAVDLNTGQRLWLLNIGANYDGYHKFSMLGNAPLLTYYPKSPGLSTSWGKVAKCDLQTGQMRDLVQINMEDNYDFILKPPAWTLANNGDSLIFFISSGWDFDLVKGKLSAYCYNVTQKKMEWENKEFPNLGNGSKHIPLIIDDKMIFTGIGAAYALNASTGEFLWQYLQSVEGFSETPPLYHEGKVYLRGGSGVVTCLDAQTGAVIWKTGASYIPAPDGRMDIYDGKLYFAAWGPDVTFHLYCLNAETGRKLWSDTGPTGGIAEGVIIDKELGYLYCMSSTTIICVDLNNTPKEN